MVTLNEFCRYLDTLLQPSLVSDYCPNGIQIEGKPEIKRFATAVSASLQTIEAAIRLEVDALIVHHGLFWNGDSPIIIGAKKQKIEQLLSKGVSLLAYHLPLDLHRDFGNNWKAARDLGWDCLQPFWVYKGIPVGVKGTFPKQSRTAVQRQLETYYGHTAQCAFGGPEHVSSGALISGGAFKQLLDAAAEGVDCFITGSFDEPAWNQSFEERVNFFALGHTATERVGPMALGEHLEKNFHLEYHFIDTPNPF